MFSNLHLYKWHVVNFSYKPCPNQLSISFFPILILLNMWLIKLWKSSVGWKGM
jgi:hypothetical protein